MSHRFVSQRESFSDWDTQHSGQESNVKNVAGFAGVKEPFYVCVELAWQRRQQTHILLATHGASLPPCRQVEI